MFFRHALELLRKRTVEVIAMLVRREGERYEE